MNPDAKPAVVADASAVVAQLTTGQPARRWVTGQLAGRSLAAPALMPFEATNVLRKLERIGEVDREDAARAFRELQDLDVTLWAHGGFADRIWELRHSVSTYDAAYVAVAEAIDAPLITLDRKLKAAHGSRCEIRVYPGD